MSTLDDADTICIRDISMNSLIYTRQFIINLIILKYLKNNFNNFKIKGTSLSIIKNGSRWREWGRGGGQRRVARVKGNATVKTRTTSKKRDFALLLLLR